MILLINGEPLGGKGLKCSCRKSHVIQFRRKHCILGAVHTSELDCCQNQIINESKSKAIRDQSKGLFTQSD